MQDGCSLPSYRVFGRRKVSPLEGSQLSVTAQHIEKLHSNQHQYEGSKKSLHEIEIVAV